MLRAFSKFSLITIITALVAGSWLLPLTALAAPEHLVINEVQTSGGPGATTNDFIELFNPTSQPFDLDGYRLVKRSATSSTDTTIKSWTSSTLVPAYGFYLWANSNYTTIAAAPDAATSQIISDNNGIALRQGAADSGIIIDSLAWGTATNGLGEGALPANPEANQSLTRQSTGAGSRQDTNDNNQDFGLTASPTPQNSSTTPEATADGGGTSGGSGDSSGIPLNPGTPQPGEVVINEFVSDPTDGGNEWVELYNRTSRYIDLTNFTLEEGSGAVTTLTGGLGADLSSRYAMVYEPKGSLNNEGDIIILKYQSTIIDQVTYGNWADGTLSDNAPKAQDPNAVGRMPDGLDSNNDSIDFRLTAPTPGAVNQPAATESAVSTTGDQTAMNVVVNELYPNPPGADETGEWLELINSGSQTIDLIGWQITDGVTTHTLAAGGGQTNISSGGYLLLPRSRTKIALNNSGSEKVNLISPAGAIISTTSYQGPVTEGVSWARTTTNSWGWTTTLTPAALNQITAPNRPPQVTAQVPTNGIAGQTIIFDASDTVDPDGDAITFAWDLGDGSTSNLSSPIYTYINTGTYKVKLTVSDSAGHESKETYTVKITAGEVAGVTSQSGAADIILSELIPDPEGSDSDEWIELVNLGEVLASTDGFKLTVGTRSYELPVLIVEPGGYAVINKTEVPFTLVNSGGSVKLASPAGEITSQTNWGKAAEGESWALVDDKWLWTTAPTPGKPNAAAASEDMAGDDYESMPLSEVKLLDHGAKVQVEGVIAAPPGLLGRTIMFLAGSGLQISASGAGWPKLVPGERVRLQGSISKSSSGIKLLVRSAKRLARLEQAEVPQPHEITLAELTDEDEGSLVTVTGQIEKANKASFTLIDDSESIRVYLKNRELSWPELTARQQVKVTGFIAVASDELVLWARSPDDVVVTAATPSAQVAGINTASINFTDKETTDWRGYIVLAALGIILIVGWWWNKKKLPSPGQLIKKWFSKSGSTI